MRIEQGIMVALGYGKYFRSDSVVGLEPIEEERGPVRHTGEASRLRRVSAAHEGVYRPVCVQRTGRRAYRPDYCISNGEHNFA